MYLNNYSDVGLILYPMYQNWNKISMIFIPEVAMDVLVPMCQDRYRAINFFWGACVEMT
jgi:hypothetical protein